MNIENGLEQGDHLLPFYKMKHATEVIEQLHLFLDNFRSGRLTIIYVLLIHLFVKKKENIFLTLVDFG